MHKLQYVYVKLKVSNERSYVSWSHLHRSVQNQVKVIYAVGYQESNC